MHSVISYNDSMLNKYPPWKRELILRKRANARAAAEATAAPATSNQRATPSTSEAQPVTMGCHDEAASQQLVETCGGPYYGSVKGPKRQFTVRSGSGHGILRNAAQSTVSLESDSARGGVRTSSANSKSPESVDGYMSGALYAKGGGKMHHKVFHDGSYGDCGDDNGSLSNGEEDLQYGPGIVSKLKNRYMSLAMRENKSRPALRRFSSLEDLLDAEDHDTAAAPRGRAYNQSAKREAMKRARSVDCLSASRREMPPQPTPAIGPSIPKSKSAGDSLSSYSRKDIIIIESSNSKHPEMNADTCENVDDLKLPIKLQTIKSVFESNNSHSKTARSKPMPSASGKPLTPTGYKPVPKAKPAGLTPRRPDSILEAKGSLKQVAPIQKTPVRSTPLGSPVVNGVANERDLANTSNSSFASPVLTKQTSSIDDNSSKSFRPSLASTTRSEKCIESTRVLLENRKNAQKSRREELSKAADFLNPKPVVLVEASTPKPNSVPAPSTPPALPQRTNIGMPPVAVPPLQTRQPYVSPINSPSSKAAVPLSPTRKLALSHTSSPNPAQTSTPNSSTPIARFMNGVSSPILDPLSTPTHSSAVSGSPAATTLKQKAPAGDARSPEQETSEASLKQQPFASSPSSSVIKSKITTLPPDGSQLPTRLPPEAVSPVKNQPICRADDEAQSPASIRSSSPPLNPKHFVSLKASAPKVSPTSAASPSKPMSETAPKQSYEQSPVRTTKITTFSSTGDEITEVVEAVNTVNRPKPSKDRWHQEQSNSLVFNFVGKKDTTPDYIENDGVDISKRVNKSLLDSGYVRLPGYDDCDSSTDDWDDEFQLGSSSLRAGEVPPPCPFEFLGAAVIIKGRSNLQRQPRNKKLCISFDDSATKTFEYPSEASLLEDPDDAHRLDGSPQGGAGLASYTPSKLALSNSFELGVSRTLGSSPLPPTSKRLPPEGGEETAVIGDKVAPTAEDYLRPAGEEETVTWSAGGTSDLLF